MNDNVRRYANSATCIGKYHSFIFSNTHWRKKAGKSGLAFVNHAKNWVAYSIGIQTKVPIYSTNILKIMITKAFPCIDFAL